MLIARIRPRILEVGKLRFLSGLLALFLFDNLQSLADSTPSSAPGDLPVAANPAAKKAETRAQPLKIAVKTMGSAFEASLNSMETVDFILLPALEAQEALSQVPISQNKNRKNVVRFNAEILQESISLAHPRTMLFVRYWVSVDSYSISVLWAEPHGRSSNYPIYPTGLTVYSDSHVFKIFDYLDFRKNTNYDKPIPPRDVFRHMYGTYPVEDIRFAENETRTTSIAFSQQSKYDSVNGLRSKIIYKKEQPITVGFRGNGIKIIHGQETNQFRELPMIRDRGGRTFVVEYQPKSLNLTGNSEVLPVSIEVRDGTSGVLLRSAKLRNFERTDFDQEFALTVNRQAPLPLVKTLQDHQRLLNKIWIGEIENPQLEDLNALKALRVFFEGLPDEASSGELLRKYAVLISLNRMLSDIPELKNSYSAYLNALKSLDLPDFMFVGGYDVIKGSILWGRPSEANALAEIWFKEIGPIEKKLYVQQFASNCVKNGDFWIAARLLGDNLKDVDKTFETASLNYLALVGTCNLLANAASRTNRNAKNEIIWIKDSVGTNRVDDLLKEAKVKAIEKYNRIDKPTQAEKDLLKHINEPIEKVKRSNEHAVIK